MTRWRTLLAPRTVDTTLAIAAVLLSLGAIASRMPAALHPGSSRVGTMLETYQRVAADVPPGRIGFMSRTSDENFSGMAAFLAQDAFAPRVIERDLSQVTFAITPPDIVGLVDVRNVPATFDLLRISAGGVRIYRRRP